MTTKNEIPSATWYSKVLGIIFFTILGIVMIIAGFKIYSLL